MLGIEPVDAVARLSEGLLWLRPNARLQFPEEADTLADLTARPARHRWRFDVVALTSLVSAWVFAPV